MKKKKNFFEQGYATTIFMTCIILMFVMGIIISVKIAGKYILRVKAQTWTDAITDAASIYSTSRNGFDKGKAYTAFNKIRSYADSEFSYGITFNMWVNSDQIGVDTYYEYPWLAAGSSNSMFDFYSTYPVAHVSAVSQFLYNGNEEIIDYEVAVPSNSNDTLNIITDSTNPDGIKGITIGGVIRKTTLKMLGDQLMSQELGRYNYSGYKDSWCGEVTSQTLFTRDILSLVGNPDCSSYDRSNIGELNIINPDYNWGWGGTNSEGQYAEYQPTIADQKLCSVTVDGNEYIILKLKTNLSAQVLTPDGVKSMNISSLDSATFNVYDIDTNYYDQ